MDLSCIDKDKFRPLASEIDRIAKESPDKPWAKIPKNWKNMNEGFKDITYSQFAEAIDRAAWFIHHNIGPAKPGTFPTVAYCGPSDLRYYFLAIAAIKTGHKLLLLLAGKYTSASLQYILDASECRIFLRGGTVDIPSINSSNITFINAPEEADILESSPVQPYQYEPNFPEVLNHPMFVIHTSGSSGKQKPIVKRQGSMAAMCDAASIPNASDGRPIIYSIRNKAPLRFSAFPIAHGGGVENNLVASIYLGRTIIVVQDDPLSVQTLLGVVRHTGCQSVLLTPYTCAELVQSPNRTEIYETLSVIGFAGGPLPKAIGDELSRHALLVNFYGQTENMSQMVHLPRNEDWEYVYSTPEWAHYEFRYRSDGEYEAFVVKHSDLRRRYLQQVFWIFPDLDEWATNDLFIKHPTRPHHWKYAGRADDIIILGNGLNFVPKHYEESIWRKNPMLKSAILIGNGRRKLGVVIELHDPSLLRTDWTKVDQGLQESLDEFNEKSTKLCQLSLNDIIFCDEGETLPRTGKGGISRKQVEAAFKERLNRINPTLHGLSNGQH